MFWVRLPEQIIVESVTAFEIPLKINDSLLIQFCVTHGGQSCNIIIMSLLFIWSSGAHLACLTRSSNIGCYHVPFEFFKAQTTILNICIIIHILKESNFCYMLLMGCFHVHTYLPPKNHFKEDLDAKHARCRQCLINSAIEVLGHCLFTVRHTMQFNFNNIVFDI